MPFLTLLLIWLLIGGLLGLLANIIIRGGRGWLLGAEITIGVFAAVASGILYFMFSQPLPDRYELWSMLAASVGAFIFLVLFNLGMRWLAPPTPQ
jgi:uncharacterized membrane protein YeaQ/YmgE (transglycosylase-associated protein family)